MYCSSLPVIIYERLLNKELPSSVIRLIVWGLEVTGKCVGRLIWPGLTYETEG